jgi:hypothetical protein
VYLALTLDNAPLLSETTGTHVAFDHVNLFDDDAPFIGMDAEDFATLTSVFTGDNLHKIILADVPPPGTSLLHG